MSKIGELKLDPKTSINIIDMLSLLCPNNKTKYVDMLWKLINSVSTDNLGLKRKLIINDISPLYNINKESLSNLDDFNLIILKKFLEIFDLKEIELFQKFCNYNERSLIINNDITAYSTFKQLEEEVTRAEIRLNDKESTNHVKKLFENDDWIVLKPLTYESSLKYGAGTKWCTASKVSSDYFKNYAKGILIYCINKKEPLRIAAHKSLYLNDLSFWSPDDHKVDSMIVGLPQDVLDVIKTEMITCKKGNIK